MIHSKVQGAGLPVVFLHGYGENLTLWDNLTYSLSSDFLTISVDLPGFGQSASQNGPFSLEDIATDIHDYLINKIQIDEYVVLGHSLGGYIALAMADKFSKYVKGFGLINSTSLEDSPEKKHNRNKTADFIEKHGAEFFLKSFVPNLFMEENRVKLEQEIAFVQNMGKGISTSVLVNYMYAMRQRPAREHLLGQYENVLFIGGEKDPQFTVKDYQKQLDLLKNQDFGQIISDVAHMSMYEAPDEIQNIVYIFLRSIITD